MGIFRNQTKQVDAVPMPRDKNPRTGANGDGAISIIGPGMTVVGDLTTEGTIRVEGRVEGSVRAGRIVLIGRDGEVVGDVITHEAVIAGRIQGTVVAENRLELQSTAVIEGEIHARAQHLKLDEGARFNGRVRMLDAGTEEVLAIPASTAVALEPG
jgi:cytoskeletal protein CcmA (bactofilin family)